ncbi:DsbA family protein [Kozakia baliensis]|uniref:DsbA family protein n=1 Tax=Kozakia baliensis TaxID=153496 RepID=UPI000B10E463|nr:DsbA family protein [Kozakia baliensis]
MPRLFRARFAGAFLALGVSAISAVSAQAETAPAFTPQQRQEIVDIMRQALKSDPSILSDAILALRQGAQAKAETDALKYVRQNHAAIQNAPAYAVRGNPNGDVTVVEFLDPRCGYCRSLVPVIDKLVTSDPKLRLVEKIIPVLSDKSVLDSQAILAAAMQGGYDKMKRALMQDTTPPTIERIKQLASANGLNAEKLEADLHSSAVSAQINENLAQARGIGLDGTPTFIFGTASIAPGAMTMADMQNHIRDARKG